jgi:hypothetical protein
MANGYAPLQIGLPTRRGKVSANRNDGIGPCAAKTGPSPWEGPSVCVTARRRAIGIPIRGVKKEIPVKR